MGYPPQGVGVPPYTSKPAQVYPPAPSPGVTLDSSGVAWAWGSWVEIVPANTITNDFIITAVESRSPSDIVVELQIGVGAPGAETPIISIPWNPGGAGRGIWNMFHFVPVRVPANSRVAGRVTENTAIARAYENTKIVYHELPL